MTIGERIIAARKVLDMSQGRMAQIVGVSLNTLKELEDGKITKSAFTIERIEKFLKALEFKRGFYEVWETDCSRITSRMILADRARDAAILYATIDTDGQMDGSYEGKGTTLTVADSTGKEYHIRICNNDIHEGSAKNLKRHS